MGNPPRYFVDNTSTWKRRSVYARTMKGQGAKLCGA